jgi:hypothetical protein
MFGTVKLNFIVISFTAIGDTSLIIIDYFTIRVLNHKECQNQFKYLRVIF